MIVEKAKSDFEIARMEQEALIKKQLMAEEFSYNMQLAQIQASANNKKRTRNKKIEKIKELN